MIKNIRIAIFISLFCMLPFTAIAGEQESKVTEIRYKDNKVKSATGVTKFAPGKQESIDNHTIKVGDTFAEGWVIAAPGLTQITLTSRKGQIKILPGAKIMITLIGDNGESYRVLEGASLFKVFKDKFNKSLDFFKVEHDRFVANVRGTEFGVDVNQKDSKITYKVIEGVVEVEQEGKIKIAEGDKEVQGIRNAYKISGGETRQYSLDFNEYLAEYKTYQDAEAYYRKALDDAEKKGDDQELMRALNNLGCILQKIGKAIESEAPLKRGLMIAQRHKDELSWETAFITNLGNTYHMLGKEKEAIEYYTNALAIRGNDDQDISCIYSNLSNAYEKIGQYDEAIKYLQEALKMGQRIYKDNDHEDIAGIFNNLGIIYNNLCQYEEAIDYHKKALAMRRSLYSGNDHQDIAASYNNIGNTYKRNGKYEEAIEYFELAREMMQRIYKNSDHPGIVASYTNLGLVYMECGKYEKAREYHEIALAMGRRIYKNTDHPDIAASYANLGNVYSGLNKYKKATKYLEDAVAMMKRINKNKEQPSLSIIYISLGIANNGLGKYEKSIKYYDKALKMMRRLYKGADHEDIALCYFNLSDTFFNLGKFKKAIDNLNKSQAMMLRLYKGNDHPNILKIYNILASTYEKLGKTAEAEEARNSARKMGKRLKAQ